MLSIAEEMPKQDEVVRLLEEAEARSAALYPAESRHGLDIDAIAAQGVRFFVARLTGRIVGCGGYLPGMDATAELKRMFVTEAARGYGVGRALLQAVEDHAREAGIRLMQLETGVKSVEARGLYGRFGYRERGPFGSYSPDPLSIFMEKRMR